MARFSADVTHLRITICGVVVLMRIIYGRSVKQEVCDKWANIANKESETDRAQTCTVRPYECTIMDCSGSATFYHRMFPNFLQQDTNITYCFGLRMNYCNDPMSMDYYLQVPTRRVTKTLRITGDYNFQWRELTQSLGAFGISNPLLLFKFKRDKNSTLHFSVDMKVNLQTKYGDITIPGLVTFLIHDHIVPVETCARTIQDTADMTPKYFAPEMCKFQPYIVTTTEAPMHNGTVNKKCDMNSTLCSLGEICDFTLDQPKCICGSNFHLNAQQDACISYSRLNQPCQHNDDCGVNEACKANLLNKKLFCQCKENLRYNTKLDICTVPPPRNYIVPALIGGSMVVTVAIGWIICCFVYTAYQRSKWSSVSSTS